MKLSVKDAWGTSVICVLRLDGSLAQEGEDYIFWRGTYHKCGRRSYHEGGVMLKNGIVCIHKMSSHRHLNKQKKIIMVKKNQIVCEKTMMGRFAETPERPELGWQKYPVLSQQVWDKTLDAILDSEFWSEKSKHAIEQMKATWSLSAKFM